MAIVERRPDHELAGSRAGGLHARTIEVLDQRGVADRFVAEGQVAQAATFGTTVLDLSDFPTRHPYVLGIWQNAIERIMAGWIAELGCARPLRPRGDGLRAGRRRRRRRALRRPLAAGGVPRRVRRRTQPRAQGRRIDFPGWEATRSNLIAEVEMTEAPELGLRHDAAGIHALGRADYEIRDGEVVFADAGPVRVTLTERRLGPSTEPTLRDLSEALVVVYGTDFGAHRPTWISRFTDATRQAATYRAGRVLLAGDAAHVHYPAGGQGISLGIQDAANLGWKLARVVDATAPEGLLDSYHRERHPVGARVLRHTTALTALQRRDDRMQALVGAVSGLASMDEPRRHLAGIVSGLDVRLDLGEGHPLLGRRMPDLDLVTDGGPTGVYALLHQARPVLLVLDERDGFDIARWADRVDHVHAACEGSWELPVLGDVPAPAAVLIRPDGHVAWVGDGTDGGLEAALTSWFGPADRARQSRRPTISSA